MIGQPIVIEEIKNRSRHQGSWRNTENDLKCYGCGRTDHFVRSCPNKNNERKNVRSKDWALVNNACFRCGSFEHFAMHCKQKN